MPAGGTGNKTGAQYENLKTVAVQQIGGRVYLDAYEMSDLMQVLRAKFPNVEIGAIRRRVNWILRENKNKELKNDKKQIAV